MSKAYYAHDTSASRRTRALYSSGCDLDTSSAYLGRNSNSQDDVAPTPSIHPQDVVVTTTNYQKWDQMSMDSGFSSDLERKVAQPSVAGSYTSSIDEIIGDAINPDDVRAPSRAKLTNEEKQQRNKIRTLPPPGRATRYHHCYNGSKYLNEDGGAACDTMTTLFSNTHCNRTLDKRSKTLPLIDDKKKDMNFLDDVTLSNLKQIRVLGGGGYARVDLVEMTRYPGHRFALKKLNKRLLQERNLVGHVVAEKEALKRAKSRFIPRLYRTFQTSNHVFMLTEACLGGDLFSLLEGHGALNNDVTRYVIGCIIEALDHLHGVLNAIHRDVKTENILIGANGVAKLADLGFCKQLPHSYGVTNTFCGTPGYVAPEVLLRTGHGRPCDFFSTGVVLFEVTTCRSPFRRHSNSETYKATLRGIKDVAFPQFLNHLTVQMIRSLCCHEQDRRIGTGGCEQVRQHDFFRGFDWHRLRQEKMASPLLSMTSRTSTRTSPIAVNDDYHENFTEISKNSFDKTWNENF